MHSRSQEKSRTVFPLGRRMLSSNLARIASSSSGNSVKFSFSRSNRRPMESTVCIFFFSSLPPLGFCRVIVACSCSTRLWILRQVSICLL